MCATVCVEVLEGVLREVELRGGVGVRGCVIELCVLRYVYKAV